MSSVLGWTCMTTNCLLITKHLEIRRRVIDIVRNDAVGTKRHTLATGEFRRFTESLSNIKVCRTIERRSNNLFSLEQARVSLFELEHHFDECFYSAFRPGFSITIQEDRPLARIKIVGADLDLIIGCLLVA